MGLVMVGGVSQLLGDGEPSNRRRRKLPWPQLSSSLLNFCGAGACAWMMGGQSNSRRLFSSFLPFGVANVEQDNNLNGR